VIRLALAQLNVTVGDLDGNSVRIAQAAARATDRGADLVCFPELALTGYPPEDLVLRHDFVDDNLRALRELATDASGLAPLLVGFVDRSQAGIHNAAAVLHGGGIITRYRKIQLPNTGVFDERRYFVPGEAACGLRAGGTAVGISICEDAWHSGPPFEHYAEMGAGVIANINGSPYHLGKTEERLDVLRERAAQTGAWIAYVNLVGGQDELVFDGGSVVVAPDGEVVARAARFEEDLLVVDLDAPAAGQAFPGAGVPATPKRGLEPHDRDPWPGEEEEVWNALVLGLRDYVRKNRFSEVALGLSGGIDSAVVAVLAADALGPSNVRALAMPSPFSSEGSVSDSVELAERVGIRLDVIPIAGPFDAYGEALGDVFEGTEPGLAEENLQARIRGNLLMALSNRFGCLVLATGNKSEMACGYSTLYGDMSGGFAPIKDVPKTLVYRLAEWRNTQESPLGEPPIPMSILIKPPSAELRPDQKDTDSLPPYDQLDPIIEAYVEEGLAPDDIILAGANPEHVERAVRLIDLAEHKRRQAAPGVKITPKAFGKDRRMPITNRYRRG
jgi:NAD+ synthase (glutamine-hydrolysing)